MASMTDRTELLEAALDSRPDGIALLGMDGEVVLWNQAAEAITGYAGIEILHLPIPASLESLLLDSALLGDLPLGTVLPAHHGTLVCVRHKLGHTLETIARRVVLRDGMGERIGTAVAFHPAESLDALPLGEFAEGCVTAENRSEFEERLQVAFDDFQGGGPPLGVLWISVDQGPELRKTHGVAASHAMLERVRRALAQGLRPSEAIATWGDNEFLIVAHERNIQMLATHAQTMVGLARTADFRWWGDRISLTVSIGVAQAGCEEAGTLTELLNSAYLAMERSSRAGGNRATVTVCRRHSVDAVEDSTCLPS
jgi:diguanylate cyclase (GGDEF)-like protein/PAS domain S-box-containing protein